MADADLQALLDPSGTGRGIQIARRTNDTTLLSSYYVVPCVTLAGRARWVQVTTGDTDEQKDTAIRAGLA